MAKAVKPLIADIDDHLSRVPESPEAQQLYASVNNLPPAPTSRVSGLFSRKHRLPRDCAHLNREVDSLREQIEKEVIAKHGQVSLYHAALIESILTHHIRLRLLERWLIRPKHVRQKRWEEPIAGNTTGEIELADRMKLMREQSHATELRDKTIAALGLGEAASEEIPWAKVFAEVIKAKTAVETNPASEGK